MLDNCEHVAQAVAIVAERLLKETRNVTLLATSRERLEVDGEHVWQVRPLPVSGLGAPAVRLFLAGPRAADLAAAPQDSDVEAVAALCARLDGLPLAIELAAARLPGTTVSELAGNLRDRFGLLTVGRRADSRHRSLRAVVDWSHEQLTPEQQDLFGQLAVFHGSFDAAAAQAIADGHDDPADVTRLLLYLVDRSLVTAELDGGTTRYRLLETLRSYGLERLAEQRTARRGPDLARPVGRDLVARAERGLRGADEASWAANLERHFSDLRAAHSWLADQDPELGLQMAAQLHWYALWRCHSEVYRWADASTAPRPGRARRSIPRRSPRPRSGRSTGATCERPAPPRAPPSTPRSAGPGQWPADRLRPSPRSPPSAANWQLRWTCTPGVRPVGRER